MECGSLPTLVRIARTLSLLLPLTLLLLHGPSCDAVGPRHRTRTAATASQLPQWLTGDLKPVMTEQPVSQTTRRSDKVLLRCGASAPRQENLTFSWLKDDQPIDLSASKNHVSTFVSNDTASPGASDRRSRRDQSAEFVNELHIVDIEEGEVGTYHCVVRSRFGSVESKRARITMHTEPFFARTPVGTVVQAGDTARFECAARGDPRPTISWSKQDEAVFLAASERRMQLMPQDSSIHIVAVRAEDAGTYVCRAESAAGVATATATLTVIQVPHFVTAMADQSVSVGEKAVLECKAAGSPAPTLAWSKNGIPVRLSRRHFLTADSQVLIIVNAGKSDSGLYACQISNSLGSVKQSLLLKVQDRPWFTPLLHPRAIACLLFIPAFVLVVVAAVVCWRRSRSTRSPVKSKISQQEPMGQTTVVEENEAETSITMTPDVVFDDSMNDRDRIPYHLDIGR